MKSFAKVLTVIAVALTVFSAPSIANDWSAANTSGTNHQFVCFPFICN
jgi:hypothetical protein